MARRLSSASLLPWLDDHWKPQRAFCGDLLGSWSAFTDHVSVHELTGRLLVLLAPRVSPSVHAHVVSYLEGRTNEQGNLRHKTQAAAHADDLSSSARALVRSFYEMDYQVFERFGVVWGAS